VGGIVQEKMPSGYEEEREEDMGDVMRILFAKGEASRSQQQYP